MWIFYTIRYIRCDVLTNHSAVFGSCDFSSSQEWRLLLSRPITTQLSGHVKLQPIMAKGDNGLPAMSETYGAKTKFCPKIKLHIFTTSYQTFINQYIKQYKTIYRGIQDSQYSILQWIAREIITPGCHFLLTPAPLAREERTPLCRCHGYFLYNLQFHIVLM